MGYRSDVILAVAVPKEHADMLQAAYMLQPGVAEYKCMQEWKKTTDGDVVIFWAEFHDVKWYETYGDVQALERMLSLPADFAEQENSNFEAATMKIRVGEEMQDVEYDCLTHGGYDPYPAFELREALESRFSVRTEVVADCDGEPLEVADNVQTAR